MAHPTVGEQICLLNEHVSTDVWGVMPGTKSRKRLEDELRHASVILMPHKDGKGLIRVARRACANIYYHSPEGLLLLQVLKKEYPGGYSKTYNPLRKLSKWSMTETRARHEKPKQAIKRGVLEELRAERGFRVRVKDDQIEQLSPDETYEEHDSDHYPGIRSGNFDVTFRIILRDDQYRPLYTARDHGMKVTSGWVRVRG